jgi:cell division protease FtsH
MNRSKFWAKFRIWWLNYQLWGWVIVVLVILAIASAIGLAFLDSYTRLYMVATMPLESFKMIMWSIVSAFFFAMIIYRSGSMSNLRNTAVKGEDVSVTFKDVIGLTEAKREAMEVVSLIKDRAKIRKIGGKAVRGLLMIGPPGCGKTFLAKAIAHEAGVPFFSIAGSEFVEVFVGVGASRVRKLFKVAKEAASIHGTAIIFIDELDVIGQQRSFSFMGGQETNSTLNQLLVNMDGLAKEGSGNVIVIGATNASETILDPALLRPGRFDRKIPVQLPNLKDREELFSHYLTKVKADPTLDPGRLARKTIGKSPADIENMVKEAALIAIRDGHDAVTYRDVVKAYERIELGLETYLVYTPKEKEQTAFHEAGHLVMLYLTHPTDDVFKATIKSRSHALGMVVPQPREEMFSKDKNSMYADIKMFLAGYVAEKVKYNVTTTGVSADFSNAMRLASTMVWNLGMSSNGFVGNYDLLVKSDRLSADRSSFRMPPIRRDMMLPGIKYPSWCTVSIARTKSCADRSFDK